MTRVTDALITAFAGLATIVDAKAHGGGPANVDRILVSEDKGSRDKPTVGSSTKYVTKIPFTVEFQHTSEASRDTLLASIESAIIALSGSGAFYKLTGRETPYSSLEMTIWTGTITGERVTIE